MVNCIKCDNEAKYALIRKGKTDIPICHKHIKGNKKYYGGAKVEDTCKVDNYDGSLQDLA